MKINGDKGTAIWELKKKVKECVEESDWQRNDKPKDIAMSLCIETAELLEIFQWKSDSDVDDLLKNADFKSRISEELADVVIYCLSMANAVNIDLTKAILNKIELNKKKYAIGKKDK